MTIFVKIKDVLFTKILILKNLQKKLNSAAQMFDNLRVKHNLAVISLDDYFCDDKKCSFYKKFESTKFPKKYDGYHLTKEASKNISNILNERIKQAIYQISN